MKRHTCVACGIEGYSPDGEVPDGWIDRIVAVHAPMTVGYRKRVTVCSNECFADELYEHESRGSEILEWEDAMKSEEP